MNQPLRGGSCGWLYVQSSGGFQLLVARSPHVFTRILIHPSPGPQGLTIWP